MWQADGSREEPKLTSEATTQYIQKKSSASFSAEIMS